MAPISFLCSLANLLSSIQSLTLSPPSSSTAQNVVISPEDDLRLLTGTLARIQATLLDSEERDIRDHSIKLWLKELKRVAYAAEDILDEYQYSRKAQIMLDYNSGKTKGIPKRNLHSSCPFPHDMADKIRELRVTFDEIAKDREALQLRDEDGKRRPNHGNSPLPTCSLVDESNLFGREKELENVSNLLIAEYIKGKKFSVLPIIGKGGLGKTTLAQLVFNNLYTRDLFDHFAWIYVSYEFDVERITRAIVEAITEESCNLNELSTIQIKLANILRDKKIFLVLDDVWNEKTSYWEALCSPLIRAKMVSMLVTTRNEQVARIIQTIPSFHLGYLPEDQSWLMFQHFAFGCTNNCENLNLIEIGRKIVRKCNGLPLALKSLASLLKFEGDEDFWREILDSALWASNASNEIFAALQISYAQLPGHLKRCFLFCSMFPQHHFFEKDLMIRLWITHGYVLPEGNKSLYNAGDGYINELMQRSFFDKCDFSKEGHNNIFKIHDIFHEFARYISGNEHFVMEGEKLPNDPSETFHLYVKGYVSLVRSFFLGDFTKLRTLVLDASFEDTANDIADNALAISENASKLDLIEGGVRVFLSVENLTKLRFILSEETIQEQKQNVLASAKNLRALVLQGESRIELLDSIGDLKHLRLLAFNRYNFGHLPESISQLYNLEMFTVSNSPLLKQFPVCMGHLISLQYLSITYTGIQKVPDSIFLLTNLETLILDGSHIETLPESICSLDRLHTLSLIYCKRLKELPRGIGNLRNLQFLDLDYCGVEILPEGIHTLISLERLSASLWVRTCKESYGIGFLKDLNNLKGNLSIYGLASIANLEDSKFACLKHKRNIRSLVLSWSESKTNIVPKSIDELILKVTASEINSLADTDLNMLETLQPSPFLKRFEIYGYRGHAFPLWMRNPDSCASLESICIDNCQFQTPFPFHNLRSLKSLSIVQCNIQILTSQKSLPDHLQCLYIMHCEKLICFNGLWNLKRLVRLHIQNCPDVQFPLTEPLPCTLEMLHIEGCRWLRSFTGLRELTKLDDLMLARCPLLQFSLDEHISSTPSSVEIIACPGLVQWCQEHGINCNMVIKLHFNLNTTIHYTYRYLIIHIRFTYTFVKSRHSEKCVIFEHRTPFYSATFRLLAYTCN